MAAPHSQALPVQSTAASSVLSSPIAPASSSSQHPSRSNHNHSNNNHPDLFTSPPIPPRTSSNNRVHQRGSVPAPVRSASERVTASSRRADDDRYRAGKDDNINTNRREKTDDVGRQFRNGGQQRPEDHSTGSVGNTRDQATSPPSSTAQAGLGGNMETIPNLGTLVKESSTVINQVVVSDPAVLIEREQARQAGAQPSAVPPPAAPAEGTSVTTTSPGGVGGQGTANDGTHAAGARSRHDYSSSAKRKETGFGHYILGQTLGEGEFGKVKLGWKRDGSIQVAIKLIRREVLGSNPSRLPKIYREISILRGLSHPNIVRLHEMVETDRHIGIIMEYASGGELFDYILNNRYLRDNAARRLFAQLVSGVGYLHKKGIVHRDLKLENLLLDRNRNIIITDFGFANTFDPMDDLGEEIEYNLSNKDFIKRMQLDRPNAKGLRRGDLMQTSCGSPCYAAPELVVSDSLYTGRKVDVWSCGVILYAMLAGYLPFDDDPANPDGDNINLLYKYIVTTSLTFPEYVTPHARDLLRRILVPDPRQRADLFEVARHSWLSDYSHIVSHITSSTTKVSDITNTTVPPDQALEGSSPLTRSASVREPTRTTYVSGIPAVGGLNHQQGDISQDHQLSEKSSKSPRETKRRTVQVEYVPPQSQTARGDSVGGPASPAVSSNLPGTVPVRTGSNRRNALANTQERVSVPRGASSAEITTRGDGGGLSKAHQQAIHSQAVASTSGDLSRTVSDPATSSGIPAAAARPTTGGSMASFNAGRLSTSYGQPVAPKVEVTNAQGRLAQPNSKHHVISPPVSRSSMQPSIGVPSAQQVPAAKDLSTPRQEHPPKSHKRSSTVSSIGEKIFSRSGSIFGGSRNSQSNGSRPRPPGKRYPPTSMRDPFPSGQNITRASTDSRRSTQYQNNRGQSESSSQQQKPRRFSLLPPSFSIKGFTSPSRSQTPDEESQAAAAAAAAASKNSNSTQKQRSSFGPAHSHPHTSTYGGHETMGVVSEGPGEEPVVEEEPINYHSRIDQQFAELDTRPPNTFQPISYDSPSTERVYRQGNGLDPQQATRIPPNYNDENQGTFESLPRQSINPGRSGRGAGLQHHRKFTDAYEYERTPSHNSGSSGAAKKVMDFFRRRAKSRVGDER